MKKYIISLFAVLAGFSSLQAQSFKEWQDASVNAVNRLPMHTAWFPYMNADQAQRPKEKASNYLSLNGVWKFNWVKDADQRPTDFFKQGYNDRGWDTMPVPGMWELNGFGDPQYTNIGYAWQYQFKNNPPYVPIQNNHVGSYRREIEIPADWNGREIIAHFGSVTSNIYLWVNGRFVGYSEDSKLEAEFDLTNYLKPGKNLIAFQTFRWCDGSYLEDQDFWRMCGVGRDCYLYSRSKATHVNDIRVVAGLESAYTKGVLNITASIKGSGNIDYKLRDADGKVVGFASGAKATIKVPSVKTWSAETPYLYTLTATLSQGTRTVEVIPINVGFRSVEIRNSQLLVNGKPVLFKGADRHELDPDGGYVVSRERMLQDITIMKENNLNAVRTCHYPDDSYWYDLCDKYGIYMVAEANLESHGMGYDEKTLAKNPMYAKAHLERNQRNVQRNFNHPAVIFWSLGNEAGYGPNFEACYKWIKAEDPSRAVQFEQAGREGMTDIYCPMYAGYERCEQYCKSDAPENSKPLIQCEYAHAMGNSMGGFKEYWDLIRKYPKYQGGFIWDFVDQSLRAYRTGREIYAYGGDFNAYDHSDNNFLDNGLISPDRVPNPHMDEVRYYYQNIWTKDFDPSTGLLSIYNENFFRDLSYCYLYWRVVADGVATHSGIVNDLAVEPGRTGVVALALPKLPADKECFLELYYRQKNAEGVIPCDWTVAREQLLLQPATERTVELSPANGAIVMEDNDCNYLIIKGAGWRMDFNRANGYLCLYEKGGRTLLTEAIRPNFWRPGTDNDYGAKLQKKLSVWRNPTIQLKSFEYKVIGKVVNIKANYDMPEVSASLTMEYSINADGEIVLAQSMKTTPGAQLPYLYRFGLRWQMPAQYDQIHFYGRGPIENYPDRNNSTFVGRYDQLVKDQAYPYIRPQETGLKTDVRWWRQTDKGGRGLSIEGGDLLQISALNYTVEDLDDGQEKDQRHFPEIQPSENVNVCVDQYHMGLGCVNSWHDIPMEKYMLPYKDYSMTVKISAR